MTTRRTSEAICLISNRIMSLLHLGFSSKGLCWSARRLLIQVDCRSCKSEWSSGFSAVLASSSSRWQCCSLLSLLHFVFIFKNDDLPLFRSYPLYMVPNTSLLYLCLSVLCLLLLYSGSFLLGGLLIIRTPRRFLKWWKKSKPHQLKLRKKRRCFFATRSLTYANAVGPSSTSTVTRFVYALILKILGAFTNRRFPVHM